ncbi:hypothetical protein [Sphaerisporangium sp. NPDC051011]|uniref:DUF7336 domain-containing protein n=1 Tax=Sphaerisporangium sp. NPDC051011 TaxID=3155792 RepID=UPI0034035772
MKVYILWHVHHMAQDDSGNVRHFESDEFWASEEEGDDVKLLGVYSTPEKAEQRIASARLLPGFKDEPDCFWYADYQVDEDQWREGYTTVDSESNI